MPSIIKYTARQEREVKVSAENPREAAELASAAFAGDLSKLPPHSGISVLTPVRELSIEVREEY